MTDGQNFNTERDETPSQDDILASIMQKLSIPPSAPTGSAPSSPMGDILTSLLSNPEMLAKLPTLLSSVKPILDMLGMGQPTQTSAPAYAPSPQSTTAMTSADMSKSADSRTALLCAMKPYLSHDRQNAIDYIVKLGRLGDILKTL